MPKLTIITINLNNEDSLRRTIESVVFQKNASFEYVFIDGGSTDNSMSIIEEFRDKITTSLSEKDTGIYNAMNKGIKVSNGEYLLFLNSGDYLIADNVVSKLIETNFDEDVVSGSLKIIDEKSNSFCIKTPPENITGKYLFFDFLPHTSTLIKKALFDEVGYFNEENKITSDWEFFTKAFILFNASYKRLPETISVFNTAGLSSDPIHKQTIQKEKLNCIKNNFKYIYEDYLAFEQLEKEKSEYNNSIEYSVYKFMEIIGLIPFLILSVKLYQRITLKIKKIMK